MSKITIYCDGGCRGNNQTDASQREAYASFAVYLDGELKKEVTTMSLPNAQTNNEAEYGALLMAFNYIDGLKARTKTVLPEIEIAMDSQLVITQMAGTAKVKALGLRKLHEVAKNWTMHDPSVKLTWVDGGQVKKILGH